MLVQWRVTLYRKYVVVALALTKHASEHSSVQRRHETCLGVHTRRYMIRDEKLNRHTVNPTDLAIDRDASGGY